MFPAGFDNIQLRNKLPHCCYNFIHVVCLGLLNVLLQTFISWYLTASKFTRNASTRRCFRVLLAKLNTRKSIRHSNKKQLVVIKPFCCSEPAIKDAEFGQAYRTRQYSRIGNQFIHRRRILFCTKIITQASGDVMRHVTMAKPQPRDLGLQAVA